MQIRIVYLGDERRAAGWALLCIRDLMMTSIKRSGFNNAPPPERIFTRGRRATAHIKPNPGQRAQLAHPATKRWRVSKSVPVMALRISVAAASLISRDACSLYQAVCGVQIRLGVSFRGP